MQILIKIIFDVLFGIDLINGRSAARKMDGITLLNITDKSSRLN